MGKETPIPLDVPPGMVLTQSALTAKGRWTGGQWMRFWRGKAQKIGGYAKLNAGPVLGVPRGATAWNDLTSRQLIAVGTNLKVYMIPDTDYVPIDITPQITSTTAANPITTTAASTAVNVNFPAHGATVVGQYVDISGAANVSNFAPNGSWPIAAIVDANNVTITAPQVALATTTGGGGAVSLGVEISPGLVDPSSGYGWGAGTWGGGTWGTPRSYTTISFSPRSWSFGNFGKILIANPINGGLYYFDPTVIPLLRLQQIATAPTFSSGVVVTSDEIVIAYGSNLNGTTAGSAADQDDMQWWASAQGVYTNWDVTAVSGPNGSPSVSGRLAQGTRMVGGVDLGVHVTLIWTDTALYEFQYTGSQFVFNILLSGRECGLIGPLAFVTVGTAAYWMGPQGLFMFNGGVQRIPNYQDVSEYIIRILRAYFTVKTIAFYNQRFNEVWFAFVPNGASEPTNYVAVTLDDYTWTAGVWPAQDTFCSATRFDAYDARPLVFGTDGNLYQMDNTLDADGQDNPWSLQLAPLELGAGEVSADISGIAMDTQRQVGNMTIAIQATDRTPANETIIDQMTQVATPAQGMVDFRVSGRQAQITFSGDGLGCDVRMGVPKLLFTPAGARR